MDFSRALGAGLAALPSRNIGGEVMGRFPKVPTIQGGNPIHDQEPGGWDFFKGGFWNEVGGAAKRLGNIFTGTDNQADHRAAMQTWENLLGQGRILEGHDPTEQRKQERYKMIRDLLQWNQPQRYGGYR